MTYGGAGEGRLSKNAKREAAREKARALREEHKKKERRNKVLLQGGIILGTLALITAIALVLVNSVRPEGPGPLNMASDGIKIGAGFVAEETPAIAAGEDPVPNVRDESSEVLDIQIWVDYMCPICGAFEAENNDQIAKLVDSGAATIEIHPISILDNASLGTKYSTRAANAAACVANYSPDSFFEYSAALFVDQPEERSEGLPNEELFARAQSVGVDQEDAIKKCIDDQQFKGWVQDSTNRALNGPIPGAADVKAIEGTPTVIVNGQKFNYTTPFKASEFAAFLVQVAGATFTQNSTATPTPTPSATP